MTNNAETTERSLSSRRIRTRIVVGVANVLLCLAIFFWIAGTIGWIRGWIYIGLLITGQSLVSRYLWKKNPEMVRSRMRVGSGTKKWDKVWLFIFILFFMAMPVAAALEVRFEKPPLPLWTLWVGMGLYIPFAFFTTWAMAVNTFFEKTVRIQHERGHRVIDTGPYRIVRHPGYTGIIFGFFLPTPLILGSTWAVIPSCCNVLWMVIRTVLEDRTLRKELIGYKEYARRVTYRLIPKIW